MLSTRVFMFNYFKNNFFSRPIPFFFFDLWWFFFNMSRWFLKKNFFVTLKC